MRRFILISAAGLLLILITLALVKFVDFALGLANSDKLVETLLTPNVRVHYKTTEFETHDETSSQGLRNKEIVTPKPKNTVRILAVGDSFTYGWGVRENETWPAKLEESLQAKFPGKKIEVINAGAPGADPPMYVHACDLYVKPLEADYVIWGLVYQDLVSLGESVVAPEQSRTLDYWLQRLVPNLRSLFVSANFYAVPKPGEEFDIQSSWVDQIVSVLSKRGQTSITKLDSEVRTQALQGLINPALINLALGEPNFNDLGVAKDSLDIALSQLRVELKRGLSSCQNEQTKFLGLLYTPSSEYIRQDYQDGQAKLGFFKNPLLLTSTLVEDELVKVVPIELKVWPATNLFRQKCADCYYQIDGHFKPEANVLISNYLSDEIEKLIR